MIETIIKQGKNYDLRAVVREIPYWPGQVSFELIQQFPEAQRPRWQRLVQITLDEHSAEALRRALERH